MRIFLVFSPECRQGQPGGGRDFYGGFRGLYPRVKKIEKLMKSSFGRT
jgi:hypothetical protein